MHIVRGLSRDGIFTRIRVKHVLWQHVRADVSYFLASRVSKFKKDVCTQATPIRSEQKTDCSAVEDKRLCNNYQEEGGGGGGETQGGGGGGGIE